MSFDYHGITTLVTGASTGIGKVFAEELAKRGSHLILTARSKDKLEVLADQIRKDYKVKVHVFPADLSAPDGPQKVFEQIQSANLDVDLLINNAGLGFLGHFNEVPSKSHQEMMQVNITSLVVLTHLFLDQMLERSKQKRGQSLSSVPFCYGVINVASTASFQPLPKLAVYGATKAFVLNFTEALWAEYKNRGIKFFCLCPGNTASEFHDKAGMDKRYRFLQAKTEDLVSFGLDTFASTNKITAVHGFLNYILSTGYRFAPRKIVTLVTALLYK